MQGRKQRAAFSAKFYEACALHGSLELVKEQGHFHRQQPHSLNLKASESKLQHGRYILPNSLVGSPADSTSKGSSASWVKRSCTN